MEPRADDTNPRGSAWQLIGAALLLGAMVGAAWFAILTPAERRVATAVAPVVAAAAQAPAREGDIAKLMQVEPATEPAPVEPAENETLICGQVLPRDALAEDRVEQTLQEVGAAQALTQFAQTQLTDGDHARAVGLVLRMHADANHGEPSQRQDECRSDDCWRQQQRDHAARVAPLLSELATLAAASTDARVVMLAREQCFALSNDAAPLPHCQALTARRLVALDRDNAVAWLALAVEEPAAIDEAMHQATIAPRWDDHATAARRYIARVDAKGGLRSMVLVQALMATPTTQSITAPQSLLQHCSAPAVARDANRRQQCEQLAQGLRARANSLMGLSTAALIAKALGRDEADAWREDARLLAHVAQARSDDPAARDADARECAVGLPRELLLRSAREGEVPAVRALMRESGLSEAQWRERLAAADAAASAAAAQQLASAAAAASAPR
jgi:hypothetical protein